MSYFSDPSRCSRVSALHASVTGEARFGVAHGGGGWRLKRLYLSPTGSHHPRTARVGRLRASFRDLKYRCYVGHPALCAWGGRLAKG
jgi:hypothetical protein